MVSLYIALQFNVDEKDTINSTARSKRYRLVFGNRYNCENYTHSTSVAIDKLKKRNHCDSSKEYGNA